MIEEEWMKNCTKFGINQNIIEWITKDQSRGGLFNKGLREYARKRKQNFILLKFELAVLVYMHQTTEWNETR